VRKRRVGGQEEMSSFSLPREKAEGKVEWRPIRIRSKALPTESSAGLHRRTHARVS
jgi:hypothetical protein